MGELGILKRGTGEGKLQRTEGQIGHQELEFNPPDGAEGAG